MSEINDHSKKPLICNPDGSPVYQLASGYDKDNTEYEAVVARSKILPFVLSEVALRCTGCNMSNHYSVCRVKRLEFNSTEQFVDNNDNKVPDVFRTKVKEGCSSGLLQESAIMDFNYDIPIISPERNPIEIKEISYINHDRNPAFGCS